MAILPNVNVFLASVMIGYVCGSIPAAVWIGRWVGGIDIRRKGSGNAGATNVARVVGTGWGILVGVIDIMKGFLPVLLLSTTAGESFGTARANAGLAIGTAAILGHLFPLFAGFKGGKGVLTALGVFGALLPLESLCGVVIWAAVFAKTRIVSLGSLIACVSVTLLVIIRRYIFDVPHPTPLVIASVIVTLLIIFTHRANIGRIIRGEESRFGVKR